MKQVEAIHTLRRWSLRDRVIFTHTDLRKIFARDKEPAFRAGLAALVRAGFLRRLTRGIYFYALTDKPVPHPLEQIAVALRRSCYNYLSLESALSEYGVISQVPLAGITVMTTGRAGLFDTPFGRIEFTHTQRTVANILDHTRDVGRPLPLASVKAALRDLRRVGRNTHLVAEEELAEVLPDGG